MDEMAVEEVEEGMGEKTGVIVALIGEDTVAILAGVRVMIEGPVAASAEGC